MSEPVTCIKKPEPAAHTPGPWRTETAWGRKSPDLPREYCGEYVVAGHKIIASTWPTNADATQHADACLIAQAPALLAHAEKSLMWLIAERDCHYECCSDPQGMVYDIEDQMTLEHYDRDIDELRALIAAAKGAA